MARILGIGNATLDIIHAVEEYPPENGEVRCTARELRCGGNTANLLAVLAQLGHACSLAGVLTDDSEGRRVRQELARSGLDITPCRISSTGTMPVSSVLLSAATGSRTIVHYRDLPEYGYGDFARLDLQAFDWLHFEGRNIVALGDMLQWSRQHYPAIPRSLEVEKPRAGIDRLFGLADVLLFSRDYAQQQNYEQPEQLLQDIHADFPETLLFCTLGGEGAIAVDRDGRVYRQPAVAPDNVVDTLGAGDTFHAAVINGSLAGLDTGELLYQACVLAGRKCTQQGLAGLVSAGTSRT
jgi:ketohexokinase